MREIEMDATRALMVDGNAVAGLLEEVFGAEMTAAPTECAHCGNEAAMGALFVFAQAPGVVLRCPACEQVVLRVVQTREALYVDARGAAYLRLTRSSTAPLPARRGG